MRVFKSIPMSLLAAALIGLGGCGDSTGNDTGKVSIYLKDAPGDLKQVQVTIEEVYLQPGADDNSQRFDLLDERITVDLTDLVNTFETMAEDVVIPAGTYAQLRFVISGACLEVEGVGGATSVFASSSAYATEHCGKASSGVLQMPSLAQSGLKVTLPDGGIRIEDEAKVLLVDFDVAQSFGKEAGNSGRWVMTPSIKASDFNLTGTVRVTVNNTSGTAIDPMSDIKVTLRDDSGSETMLTGPQLTTTGSTAEAIFRYRTPGAYTASVMLDGKTLTVTGTNAATLSSGGASTIALTVTGIATP